MKRLLIAPLNWGLGHASRCVPVIEEFIKRNIEIILAGDGLVYDFLHQRYPLLPIINLPGQKITYQTRGSLNLALARSLAGFLRNIVSEHEWLQDSIEKYDIGAIISDNRYGLWSNSIPSFLITHQINIRSKGLWKFGEPLAHQKIHGFLNNFYEIWIPDVPQRPGLAGDLSHVEKSNSKYRYLGILSRFKYPAPVHDHPSNDILAILSGPEPQRTIFENILLKTFENTTMRMNILRGLPSAHPTQLKSNGITLISHLQDNEFVELIVKSKNIICRSGYSSLMDLFRLQRTALLVPTPGQSEQEYLARLHATSGNFSSVAQNKFKFYHFPAHTRISCSNITSQDYLSKACDMVIKLL